MQILVLLRIVGVVLVVVALANAIKFWVSGENLAWALVLLVVAAAFNVGAYRPRRPE